MSAIVCFDIRNFSTHVSHLAAGNQGKSKRIFELVKKVFNCLDTEIRSSNNRFAFTGKTYVVHTGDGFVAIFYGKRKCLQGLVVACLIGKSFAEILGEYNTNSKEEDVNLRKLSPLDYGIGVHLGTVHSFDYQPVYSPDNHPHGIGLLGHAINLCSRVQDTTKEHVFNIICTKKVFQEAVSEISEVHRSKIEKSFTNLGLHKLRGMRKPVTLYGVDIDLGLKISPEIVSLSNQKKARTGLTTHSSGQKGRRR